MVVAPWYLLFPASCRSQAENPLIPAVEIPRASYQHLRQAQAVHDWWQKRDRVLPVAIFYQRGLSFCHKAASARSFLMTFAEHGLATRIDREGVEIWRRLP